MTSGPHKVAERVYFGVRLDEGVKVQPLRLWLSEAPKEANVFIEGDEIFWEVMREETPAEQEHRLALMEKQRKTLLKGAESTWPDGIVGEANELLKDMD
jgi:hypothetical protein